MKKFVLLFLVLFFIPTVNAQRGCCSHHGGVAGCSSGGRQICRDGSYSPTCTCTPSYVYGCTDKNAKNYNSSATKDDGSCTYYKYGCMDESALNYDSTAEKESGNCEYAREGIDDTSSSSNDEDDISNEDAAGSVTAVGTLGAIGYIIYRKKKKNN